MVTPELRVSVKDAVAAPLPADQERLREGFFREVTRLTAGLVRGEHRRLRLGPLTLFAFAEPRPVPGGWSYPITGGLMVGRAGGSLAFSWLDGRLRQTLDAYQPRLPWALYRRTQLPAHHAVSRLLLLHLRGRVPGPGVPAGAMQRLAAAAVDLALCAALASAVPKRRLLVFAPLAAAYHLGFWAAGGTPGARLLGQRLVSIDSSPVSPAQALVRLICLPLGLRHLRALHDEVAGTEVIEAGTSAVGG